MSFENCWEFKNCGRQRGGPRVHDLGMCPASTEIRLNRKNHGKSGGRSCWVIAGSFCKGKIQCIVASEIAICLVCDFYTQVAWEEGPNLLTAKQLLGILE